MCQKKKKGATFKIDFDESFEDVHEQVDTVRENFKQALEEDAISINGDEGGQDFSFLLAIVRLEEPLRRR